MKCEQCDESKTLWNVAFAKQNAGIAEDADWRCIDHLVSKAEVTFIVGLYGDEAKRVGRD